MTGEGITDDFAVSVIIPLFNKAPFIRRTLLSALAQSLPPLEILVVDDGSSDDGVERIRDLLGGPVRLVEQSNAGPGVARNRGIAEAKGSWIAFLDADDLWTQDHLQTLADLSAALPAADVLVTTFACRSADPALALPQVGGGPLDAALIDYLRARPADRKIWTSCVAVRRPAIASVGEFGAFWPGEDQEYWLRLSLDHQIAHSRRRTAVYVQQSGGIMDSLENGPPIGFTLNPIYSTIDRFLADPARGDKHAALLAFKTALLGANIRQALYRGDVEAARQYLRVHDELGSGRLGGLRQLTWLPGPIVRGGMALRNALKGRRMVIGSRR